MGLPGVGSKTIKKLGWNQAPLRGAPGPDFVRIQSFCQDYPSLQALEVTALSLCISRPALLYADSTRAEHLTRLSLTRCSIGSIEDLSRSCPNLTFLALRESRFQPGGSTTPLFPKLRELVMDEVDCEGQAGTDPRPLLEFGAVPALQRFELVAKAGELITAKDFRDLFIVRLEIQGSFGKGRILHFLDETWAHCKKLRYLYLAVSKAEDFQKILPE
jgi:hypothetical protein